MKIANDARVKLEYTLKDKDGNLLEDERSTLEFVYGLEPVLPKFQASIEGKEASENVQFSVPAEEAYGEYNAELVQKVPKEMFAGVEAEITPGMQFMANGPSGRTLIVVKTVLEDGYEIDPNHPLAGKELFFDVTIIEVRKSTEEELAAAVAKLSGNGGGCGSGDGCGSGCGGADSAEGADCGCGGCK